VGMTNLGQRGSTTGRPPPELRGPGTLKLTALPFAGRNHFARMRPDNRRHVAVKHAIM
jgi:hypothetical protein